jgi:hypothetical protein
MSQKEREESNKKRSEVRQQMTNLCDLRLSSSSRVTQALILFISQIKKG